MRLLLDENVPHSVKAALAAAGHDVLLVAETAPGVDDHAVLALARREQRCLVTLDSDFGDLVFRQRAAPPPAIVFVRLHPVVPDTIVAIVSRAVLEPIDGQFVVATTDAVRKRPFESRTQSGSA